MPMLFTVFFCVHPIICGLVFDMIGGLNGRPSARGHHFSKLVPKIQLVLPPPSKSKTSMKPGLCIRMRIYIRPCPRHTFCPNFILVYRSRDYGSQTGESNTGFSP